MCLFVSFALTLSLFLHLFCCFQLAVMPKHTRDVLHLGFFFKKHTQKLWGRLLCVTSCCVSPLFFALVLSIYLLHGNLGKIRIKEGRGKPFGPVLLWLLCGGHAKLVLTTVKKHCIKLEAFWTTPELSGWEGTTLGQKYFTSLCNLYYYVFIFLLPDHKVFIARDTKKRRIRGMYFTQYFVTSDKSVVQVEHISELC